ncbi:MAG: hypothetical protein M3548_01325 [Actinomycetota bacterium]|nr:hypothetical protein [Actinomycetota bacterium]
MRFARMTIATTVAGVLLATTAPVASAESPAATGQVVVFQHEFTELTIYENPKGCQALPVGSHVINNLTSQPITIYYDPLCLSAIEPVATIRPGYGTHVSSVGSFRA